MKGKNVIGVVLLLLIAGLLLVRVVGPGDAGAPEARTPEARMPEARTPEARMPEARTPAPVPVPRPNILLILADDLGNNDIGLYGDGSAQTPNIDALASAGARYRRHYTHSICRPSRLSLLTGLPASRVGVPPHVRGITPELDTLPEALGNAGYATAHIGKWHLGNHLPSAFPGRQGFDDWFGFLSALSLRHGTLEQTGTTYLNPWLQRKGGAPTRHKGHMTDLLTEAAVAKIGQLSASNQPWFINLWYFAPHEPIQPAGRFSKRFPKTPEGRYLALVAQLDDAVGRLIKALEEVGARDNTLVVFLSDNGGTNKWRDSNKPYFGRKNTFMEGGVRTPFILNLPGRVDSTDILDPVFISDVMPTLLSYAGVPIPSSVTGRNVLPLMDGAALDHRGQYFWDFGVNDFVKYGVLDLERGHMVYQSNKQLWSPDLAQFTSPVPGADTVLNEAGELYRQWARKTRLADLHHERRPDGGAFVTGDSYRRTPGFGGWTLQLPVDIGPDRTTSVTQAGQFSIDIDGDVIQVALPGHSFSVTAPRQGCQLMSLSSYYAWSDRQDPRFDTQPGGSIANAGLYLGEESLYEQQFFIPLDIMNDRYDPIELSDPEALPAISNEYLKADLLEHYLWATGRESLCSEAAS
jgi:arylsulfatase A-like enzyme